MSRRGPKGSILPPLQRRIILCLAEEGLQTINEIVKNIPILGLAKVCHYKPTWLAVKSLGEKGVIHEVGVKEYRGRKYPQFWLTDDGLLVALTEGGTVEHLLQLTKQIYPNNRTLACYLEVASQMNPEIVRILYSAFNRSGKIEPADLAMVFVAEMQTKDRNQRQKAIIDTLRAYPKEYGSFKKRMNQIMKDLDKLKEMI